MRFKLLHAPWRACVLGTLFRATTILCLVIAACTQPAQPSEDFTRAHARFIKLYAKSGDEAFLDQDIADIESELRLVPSNSLDADSARELLERIQKGRAAAIARGKEIEQAVARATAPPPPSEPERPTAPKRLELAPARPVPATPLPQEPEMLAEQAPSPDTYEERERLEALLAQAQARQQAALADRQAQVEASWRRRFQEANSRITQLQDKLDELQRGRESNGMPVNAFGTIQCNSNTMVCTRSEYNESTRQRGIEKLKKMLTQAENDLADLERQASAQSVPREWRR